MSDYSSIVVHSAATILELCKDLDEKLKGYLVETDDRPDISYELLKILTISDDLVQLANPDKISGEFFGLPKEVVGGSKEAAVFSNDHGWDFGPWFGEKSGSIKLGIKKVIKYWEMDPETVELHEEAQITSKEFVRVRIDSGIREVKAYAKVVFDQFFSDKVSVEK
ncbi:hypothetical protein M3210_16195 [Oceanobacillus luteolus]|mgnify:FL=1|uniref:hypothetical protein n=1 Tax=Oceanobacillus luteolus TaxID=1274358 RepID=UPI0020412CEE|nr:hypothetical protein [Oceanobacillus luteolus]MCM3741794.1 hypothetical protein [Oceanobacillus luteolus]